MSRTVGPKGATMRATVDARRRAARVPSAPTSNDHAATADAPDTEAALEAWRAEQFAMLADDEGRAIGKAVYTQAERHNARRRRDRAAAALAATPEGRAALSEASGHVAGVRSIARMFARVGADFRPAVADGFRLGTQAIAEHGVRSRTAAAFATGYGLLFATGMHLEGEAAEAGTRIMAVSKATTDKGVKATAALSGYRDLQQLALACFSKAAVMFHMMLEAEADARTAEKERRMQQQHRAWAEQRTREEAERRAKASLPAPVVVDAVDAIDATEAEPEPAPVQSRREPAPDDEEDAAARAVLDAQSLLASQGHCPVRGRMVPAHMIGRPKPSAGDGPNWVRAEREERDELARFDAELARARQLLAASQFRRRQ